MSEHTFGPHHPLWTQEHQEASEPTERELLLIEQRDEAQRIAVRRSDEHVNFLNGEHFDVCAERDRLKANVEKAKAVIAEALEQIPDHTVLYGKMLACLARLTQDDKLGPPIMDHVYLQGPHDCWYCGEPIGLHAFRAPTASTKA